jgi:hypothetical protein
VVCVTRNFDLFRFRRLSPDDYRRGGGRFKLDHLSGILADPSLRRFPTRKSRVASEFGIVLSIPPSGSFGLPDVRFIGIIISFIRALARK